MTEVLTSPCVLMTICFCALCLAAAVSDLASAWGKRGGE